MKTDKVLYQSFLRLFNISAHKLFLFIFVLCYNDGETRKDEFISRLLKSKQSDAMEESGCTVSIHSRATSILLNRCH